ncbi:MAG TPA: DUF302 domain-containing protein [Bryobacteraceae bacterium]|nr:DUF302 domain-containing protein [Bryobacteraceae bacterium]
MQLDCRYGYLARVSMPFEDAVGRLEASLKAEGFGLLCNIDIQAKLKEKLGIDFPRYVILGACNPPLAYKGLQQEMNLGLLLPCNAVVYERDGAVFAGAVDAAAMLSVVGNAAMQSMAEEVNARLRRAVDRIAGATAG